ncbi:hypothetical protein M0R45_007958 [Rubus argutus]|uniref:Uncharacterized protein n=1 Tax=Rubus argutus TaxID=59490 RepID=A0AAW1Y342_RUBAR
MGKKIVHEESPKEPGEHSRLWYYQDVLQVLTKNTGTSKIEGIMPHLKCLGNIQAFAKSEIHELEGVQIPNKNPRSVRMPKLGASGSGGV